MSDSEDQRKCESTKKWKMLTQSLVGKEIEQIETGTKLLTSRKKKLHRRKLESDDEASDNAVAVEETPASQSQPAIIEDEDFDADIGDDEEDITSKINRIKNEINALPGGGASLSTLSRKRSDKAESKAADKVEKATAEHPAFKRLVKRRKGEELTDEQRQ